MHVQVGRHLSSVRHDAIINLAQWRRLSFKSAGRNAQPKTDSARRTWYRLSPQPMTRLAGVVSRLIEAIQNRIRTREALIVIRYRNDLRAGAFEYDLGCRDGGASLQQRTRGEYRGDGFENSRRGLFEVVCQEITFTALRAQINRSEHDDERR